MTYRHNVTGSGNTLTVILEVDFMNGMNLATAMKSWNVARFDIINCECTMPVLDASVVSTDKAHYQKDPKKRVEMAHIAMGKIPLHKCKMSDYDTKGMTRLNRCIKEATMDEEKSRYSILDVNRMTVKCEICFFEISTNKCRVGHLMTHSKKCTIQMINPGCCDFCLGDWEILGLDTTVAKMNHERACHERQQMMMPEATSCSVERVSLGLIPGQCRMCYRKMPKDWTQKQKQEYVNHSQMGCPMCKERVCKPCWTSGYDHPNHNPVCQFI